LQRLSGLFLLIMVPAHLVFMHLNPAVARDASTVLARIQNPLIKLIDIALAVGVFYHGACGLISIAGDYVANRWLRVGISLLVAMLMIGFGIRIIISSTSGSICGIFPITFTTCRYPR
jgi:succinate dehydrogenase hydrophobic anchor subunit